MMAEAFASVHFPIRPVLHQDDNGNLVLFRRNTKLITPSDFDYSPYFDVIKYPLLGLDELAVYRKLPWDRSGVHCNDIGDCFVADKANIELVATGYEHAEPDPQVIENTEEEKSQKVPQEEAEPSAAEAHLKQQHNT
jgi:hypothetical protein